MCAQAVPEGVDYCGDSELSYPTLPACYELSLEVGAMDAMAMDTGSPTVDAGNDVDMSMPETLEVLPAELDDCALDDTPNRRDAVCATSRQLVGVPHVGVPPSWASRTPSRPSMAASRTGTTSAGWRARRRRWGGRVGERAGAVNVEVELDEAVAVRQTSG